MSVTTSEEDTTIREVVLVKRSRRGCGGYLSGSESLESSSASEPLDTQRDLDSKSDGDEEGMERELTEDDIQFLLDNTGEFIIWQLA